MAEVSDEEIEERAAKGAALLDERVLDWPLRIKRSQLDMSMANACVLGQLEGHYVVGLVKLGLRDATYVDADLPEAEAYGFTSWRIGGGMRFWRRLTAAWKRQVRQRLEARKRGQ